MRLGSGDSTNYASESGLLDSDGGGAKEAEDVGPDSRLCARALAAAGGGVGNERAFAPPTTRAAELGRRATNSASSQQSELVGFETDTRATTAHVEISRVG